MTTLKPAANPDLPPAVRAKLEQMLVHGQEAVLHGRRAMQNPDTATRFNHLVRTADALDHAITDSSELPGVRDKAGAFYAAYGATRLAIDAILASGKVKGREQYGAIEIDESRNHFLDGTSLYGNAGRDQVERHRSLDLVNHSIQDATTGLVMLRRGDVALQLIKGLNDTRTQIQRGKALNTGDVKTIQDVYGKIVPAARY